MNEKKHITFIVNPISGTRGKEALPELIAAEMDKERFDVDIRQTEYAGQAAVIARECAEAGDYMVVAVGGDGTVNEVARSLTHTETALGIVPCGSGNGLARHLCLPLSPRKALGVINAAVVEQFDYGVVNGLPFFCTCGMGFDAFISLKFAEAGKRGPLTYIIACANASQYGNNAYIAPNATMKDGLMDVIIMEPFTAMEAPQISIDLMNKTLAGNSKIKTFRTKSIHIHRTRPGAIHYDGDPIMTGADVDVHIEASGIRIVTNPDATEDPCQPNPLLNAFSDLFNNINNVREDIEKSGRRIQVLNKLMLRKLSKL